MIGPTQIRQVNELSRGLGRVEKRILEYLDEKAKRSKVTQLKTIESYVSTSEISERLDLSGAVVCQAINALGKSGQIRIYPNGRRRNRYFGSALLPIITEEELSRTFETILSVSGS